MFQLTEPIKVLKQKCSQSAQKSASKKATKIEPIYINYQLGKQEWLQYIKQFSFWYTKSLFLQCILNIKPLGLTSFTLRAYQVYRVFQDHQKAAAHLNTW